MDCWSKLPEHLIEIFAEKLDSHRDFLSFSAVCTSWRFVFKNNIHRLPSKIPISHCLPKGKPLPLLLVQYSAMDSKIHSLFSLSNENEKRAKILIEIDLSKTKNKWIMSSCRGWLFVVDYITYEIVLIKPLTGEEVRLPSFPSLSYSLVRIKNVVSSYPNKYDWIVMFAFNHINICFCRVGDDKWNIHTHSRDIVNFINHNGIFYVMDTNSDLYRITTMKNTIDMKFILVQRIFGDPRCRFFRKFLVESSGELLLVTHANAMMNKHLDGIPHFEIFKLTSRYVNYNDVIFRKECEWQKIEDIGNQTIFFGQKGSISVESCLYPGIKENCIYFPHIIDGKLHIAVSSLINWSVEYFSLDVDANVDEVLWFSPNPW